MAKSPAQRRTQAERREETRSRILEAAVSELSHNGYAGFRVDKVAIAAKVSRGAQSHHFPTKESLVLAALETLYQASTEASIKVIENLDSEDVLDALMQGLGQVLSGAELYYCHVSSELGRERARAAEEGACDFSQVSLTHREAWLDALLRSGLDEEPARTILNITQSVYRGMTIRRFLRNDPDYARFTFEQWSKIARAFMDQHTSKR